MHRRWQLPSGKPGQGFETEQRSAGAQTRSLKALTQYQLCNRLSAWVLPYTVMTCKSRKTCFVVVEGFSQTRLNNIYLTEACSCWSCSGLTRAELRPFIFFHQLQWRKSVSIHFCIHSTLTPETQSWFSGSLNSLDREMWQFLKPQET